MLESAFARTFGNFWTVFMIVAVVVFPLHLVYAFVFRDVIATSDFHAAIEAMPNGRRVAGVAPGDLDNARLAFWVISGLELALVPVALRATRRALEVDAAGGVPTASDAWADVFRRHEPRRLSPGWPAAGAIGVVAAVTCGSLIAAIAGTVNDLLVAPELRWVGEAVGQGVTRASALPLFLGPVASFWIKGPGASAPKLY